MTLTPKDIVEAIMTQHWDMAACPCWICEVGQSAGCRPKEHHLAGHRPSDHPLEKEAEL